MVARPGINSVKDLKGRIVVAPLGSTTYYLLLRALKDAPVDIVAVGKFLLEQGWIKNAVTKEAAVNFLHPEFLEAVHAEMWK